MELQRGRGGRRVHLTDQALVAVTLARDAAGRAGRAANVADLLLGLAAEPDGAAGRALREQANAAARLPGHTPAAPAATAGLDPVLRRAATLAAPRPAGTRDLLDALLDVGGDDFDELLAAVGYDPSVLRVWQAPESGLGRSWTGQGETYGLDPGGRSGLTPAAAQVLAQVRAAAGGAVDLVAALARAPAAATESCLDVDPTRLDAALAGLCRQGRAAGPAWDRGLDTVVEAARAWRGEQRVSCADLLRASIVAGGDGPRRLLDATRRGDDRDPRGDW